MTTPTMAPYRDRILGLLGDREPVQSLRQTAARIQEVASRLGPAGFARPWGPGKWTGAQVLAHLADAEMVFGYRLRQMLTVDDYVIQPFDQDRWAERYDVVDGEQAAAAFTALRAFNLALIARLSEKDRARDAYHPERGPEGVAQILKMMAGHDLNHLAQLEQALTAG